MQEIGTPDFKQVIGDFAKKHNLKINKKSDF